MLTEKESKTMKLTDKESNNLQKEIDHILDSGANSVRILNMIDLFLFRRDNESSIIDCNNCIDGKCRVYNSGESSCVGILTANCKYHNK